MSLFHAANNTPALSPPALPPSTQRASDHQRREHRQEERIHRAGTLSAFGAGGGVLACRRGNAARLRSGTGETVLHQLHDECIAFDDAATGPTKRRLQRVRLWKITGYGVSRDER